MIGLDTNILVRYLTYDDPRQAKAVLKLFEKAEREKSILFVSACVLLELIWVLGSMGYSRVEILSAIRALPGLSCLRFESQEALPSFYEEAGQSNKANLSDCLIGVMGKAKKCEYTLTFDKKAAKGLDGFRLLKV